MEGLHRAAAAVQSSEFATAHERLLDQPGSTPVEVLQQLKQAAKVVAKPLSKGSSRGNTGPSLTSCRGDHSAMSINCHLLWLA